MIPMKVGKCDKYILLISLHLQEVSPQLAYASSRVDNTNTP